MEVFGGVLVEVFEVINTDEIEDEEQSEPRDKPSISKPNNVESQQVDNLQEPKQEDLDDESVIYVCSVKLEKDVNDNIRQNMQNERDDNHRKASRQSKTKNSTAKPMFQIIKPSMQESRDLVYFTQKLLPPAKNFW
uniref:Uncharacterized protein n=1 Tax=Ditylenchus dipsaci TaxID=166011 RepID=A0A915DNB4_9BILA